MVIRSIRTGRAIRQSCRLVRRQQGKTTNALPAQPALITGIFPWLRPEAEGLRINLRQPDLRWSIAPFLPAAVSAPSPLPLDGFQPNPILSRFGFLFQLDHDRAPSEPGMPFRLVHRAQMPSVPSSGPFHLRRTPNIPIEPLTQKNLLCQPFRSVAWVPMASILLRLTAANVF